MVKVEIWSDILCPWCGLGNHRLDRAVERFAHGDEVEVIHRSFPLDAGLSGGTTMTTAPGLTVISGPLTDQEVITKAVIGADAVISALGPSLDRSVTSTGVSEGTRNIVTAMNAVGVKRFLGLATPYSWP
jgi:nucleoside-diphosphate-sugar epimerase